VLSLRGCDPEGFGRRPAGCIARAVQPVVTEGLGFVLAKAIRDAEQHAAWDEGALVMGGAAGRFPPSAGCSSTAITIHLRALARQRRMTSLRGFSCSVVTLAIRSVATRSETIRPAPAVWKEKPMTIHYRDHLIETAIYEPRDGKTYVPRATLCRYVGPKAKVKDLSWPNRVCRTWIDAATLAISLAKAAIDRGEGVEDTPTRN
jgi:hypothetical protein